MTLSPVKKWTFPVIINSKKEPLTADDYHAALMSTSTGFYPVSVTNLMHMGIHFDKTVLKELGDENERKVHCIADGEVVAYRINGNYQTISYGDTVAYYSTGFVLVRHLLEMERVEEKKQPTEPNTENSSTTEKPAEDNSPASSASKANDTATSTNSTADKADTESENKPAEAEKEKLPPHQLYFYSLYMHLADTAFYDKNSKMPTPAFWEQDIYRVLPNHKELNKVEGLCIRDKADNSKNDSILAVLQVGTKVNLNLDLHDENHNWYAVTSLAEGYSSIPELKSIKHTQGESQIDILGWIFIGKEVTSLEFEILELKAHEKLLSDQSEKISILTKEFNTNWVKSKGLRVRKDKKILSMLPGGTQVKISGNKKAKHFVELTEVIRDGKPTIPLPKGNTKIWFDCLERISRGKKYNEVVVLDTPFPIKAGDLIGHIGHDHTPKISLSQNSTEIKCETNLHVECFTCDDLPNFIALTQAEASKLPEEEKTLLGISKQAKLLKSPKDADTDVGQHTEIKVISKDINVKWLQIEITESKTKKKTVWIENSEEISKNINSKGNITLATDNKAWSEYPLQASELANNSSIIDTPLLLDINNGVFKKLSHRAVDKDGTLWVYIEHALDKNNAPIRGWLVINKENVKKVSCWDWFDFKLIEEKATTKEFYLDVKKSLSRDNASLEAYKPTLKETLTILDRQYHLDQKKYAKIDAKSFNGIKDKPQLSSALSRLLIKSESEWYSEIDAQGKMPKWDALDSEFNEKAKKVLGYLEDGDVTKCDAYISTLPENEQESVKRGLLLKRQELEKKGINNNKTIEDSFYTELKLQVARWDNEKEKIKKMLWWDDVVKGLAKQNNTNATNSNSANKSSSSAKVKPPAEFCSKGKAWFINPIIMEMFKFTKNNLTIVIDPGHGYTQGSTGASAKIYEYKIDENKTAKADITNLPQKVIDNTNLIVNSSEDLKRNERGLVFDVSIKLKQLLEANGYNVILTRTERRIEGKDDQETRQARIDLANKNNADYFISIHADDVPNYSISGSHVIYPNITNSEVVALSKELAEDIFSYYTVVPVEPSSPKKDVRGLQVLRNSNKTKRRVLIELGFISSPKDAKALFSNIDLIAHQLYKGLLKNLKKYH
ncbi:N-acetylmuramoyl-L-alanine amidase [Gilliamella sp. B14384G15]|uniref:N-acetylmuramoyl-L-alanine amidase family protein n=1 Tax=unclassified Gilliamella TaxID=2685620 RepID=UPI0018DE7541|nr:MULTISPECIES: N-acetylmuramoyl-L-alanine amidase [unclassified Gilliamella]MBI0032035.1 N-acetylmuramoyl-L-alanine amidase [Gilliamella sp. B14384G15]MBI0059425.1 N-acetylmuramoyl-L-alanine amidase [Gilliamella sp. B14384G12]